MAANKIHIKKRVKKRAENTRITRKYISYLFPIPLYAFWVERPI